MGMELTHDELERYLCRIFSGELFVVIDEDTFLFKQPSNNIKMRADFIYDRAYSLAISEGLLPSKELEKLIEKRNLYTKDDEKKLSSLESKLYAQQVLLAKTTKVRANQDRIKSVIDKYKSEINEIKSKKQNKLLLSAETKAEEDKLTFLCWACSYKYDCISNIKQLYWDTYDMFLSMTDMMFRQKVVYEFSKFYMGIESSIIRYIARSGLWRIRYVHSIKTSDQLFGMSSSEFTNDMMNLAYWSNFYNNVYEMMPEDRPSDLIIDDDEALDAYMKSYYEERNREDAARRSKVKTKGRLSAFDSEEVIVTQSNELYQDIKYDKPREAARAKSQADMRLKAGSNR